MESNSSEATSANKFSSVDDFNFYISEDWAKTVKEDGSFKKLSAAKLCVSPILFKKLEHKLTAVMWDIFEKINQGSDLIEINLAESKGKLKHESLRCKVPVKEGSKLLLPCIHRVHAAPQKGGYQCASIFGVSWLGWVSLCLSKLLVACLNSICCRNVGCRKCQF